MTTEENTPTPHCKLKVLVISMGGTRQAQIQAMFEALPEFAPPVFSPGVPSRELRNRYKFLYHAHRAGLLPEAEWTAIRKAHGQADDESQPILHFPEQHSNQFFDCLQDIPVTKEHRRGSQYDLQLHYSVELWRKARGVNRGRAVLACTLAHLMAMRRLVEEDLDVILEDNVRACPETCAEQVWETLKAKHEWENANSDNTNACHYLYFGWLGSITNLKWILQMHVPKRKFERDNSASISNNMPTIFPFPRLEHLEEDLVEWKDEDEEEGTPGQATNETINDTNRNDQTPEKYQHKRPGGNPVWGAYAYWISQDGYDKVMESLRNDVGAMLWKGKRMRHYLVKPIDKILPRQTMALMGPSSVQLTTHPAFFRAPMLTSKIHTQWDPEFCKSTDYQLRRCVDGDGNSLEWSKLWLSSSEKEIVQHYSETGQWRTVADLQHQGDAGANKTDI